MILLLSYVCVSLVGYGGEFVSLIAFYPSLPAPPPPVHTPTNQTHFPIKGQIFGPLDPDLKTALQYKENALLIGECKKNKPSKHDHVSQKRCDFGEHLLKVLFLKKSPHVLEPGCCIQQVFSLGSLYIFQRQKVVFCMFSLHVFVSLITRINTFA